MNSSESGRKLNQAVSTTSKAVGGALSQAKGAFSNFWSAFTAPVVPTTPTANHTPNEHSDEIASNAVEEMIENETDEAKKKQHRKSGHPKNDIICARADDEDRFVEIAKEADALDTRRKGELFDI